MTTKKRGAPVLPDFAAFSGMDGQPTEGERRLIEASRKGAVAVLKDLDEAERVVSPALIVALALRRFRHADWPLFEGETQWPLHDHGLMLTHAIIRTRLVASNYDFPTRLMFMRCRFEAGVNFSESRIDGGLVLNHSEFAGECRFMGTEIAGQLNANGAKFRNPGQRAVWAQGASASDWFMRGAEVEGEFDINSARLAGQFSANEAKFRNAGERAIRAQAASAVAWFMNGAEVEGEFAINSARLRDEFSANGAKFRNAGNRAVWAQGVSAAGWFMNGAEVEGKFAINSARLTGQFVVNGAWFRHSGNALSLNYSGIAGGVFLRPLEEQPCRIEGGFYAAHARIGVICELDEAVFDCGKGFTAIDLTAARIEGRLKMPRVLQRGIIDLSRAWCDILDDDHEGWPKPLERDCDPCGRETFKLANGQDTGFDIQHLVLDGFRYEHLEHADGGSDDPIWKARIRWLSGQSAKVLKQQFDPQPWRQCAKVLRETGFDEAAQKISIARRERERRADDQTKNPTAWQSVKRRGLIFSDWFLHKFADYGYSPWKGVRWSVGLIILCSLLYSGGARLCGGLDGWESRSRLACSGQPAFVQTKFNDFEEVTIPGSDGQPKEDALSKEKKHRPGYPEFRAFAFSLDAFVPLLDLGSETYWRANTRAWWSKYPVLEIGSGKNRYVLGRHIPIGWMLYALSVIQMILGSIFIAVTITGFTGLLTRDDMK